MNVLCNRYLVGVGWAPASGETKTFAVRLSVNPLDVPCVFGDVLATVISTARGWAVCSWCRNAVKCP